MSLAGILLILGAAYFVGDALVTTREAIEDPETGEITGYKPLKYSSLWDYLKRKIGSL